MTLLLLLGCATGDADTAAPIDPVTLATSPGPFGVGHRTATLELTDLAGEARSVATFAWYPTDDTSGTPATYFRGLLTSEVAWEDAAPRAGEHPVVVYSHGHQGYGEAASFLAEHLASHGFVVVAPDHTGNTTFDGDARDTLIYLQRTADLAATLDALEGGALADLDGSGPIVAMGHSFGGYTVYGVAGAAYDVAAIAASCADGTGGDVCTDWDDAWAARFAAHEGDPRVVAAIAMAPGDFRLFGAAGAAAVDVPTLQMTGELDGERDADGAEYRAALVGHPWLDLTGGGHNAFVDLAGSLGDGQTLDPEIGHRVVRAYSLAFAAHHTGDARMDDLLDGSVLVDEAGVLR